MITAKQVREITDKANSRTAIDYLEGNIVLAANQGARYASYRAALPNSEVNNVADYFKANGFVVEYTRVGIDGYSGVPVYSFTVRW